MVDLQLGYLLVVRGVEHCLLENVRKTARLAGIHGVSLDFQISRQLPGLFLRQFLQGVKLCFHQFALPTLWLLLYVIVRMQQTLGRQPSDRGLDQVGFHLLLNKLSGLLDFLGNSSDGLLGGQLHLIVN